MAIEDNQSNKRVRVESEDFALEANSAPNSKLPRLDSGNTRSNSLEVTHVEPDPDDGNVQLPEAKHIPEELLSILDDSDPVNEPDPEIHGLDLVIKSFEEEIMVPNPAPIPVTKSGSDEALPELGFLLEASDFSFFEEEQTFANFDAEEGEGLGAVGFAEKMGYEFPMPSYESFEFGVGGNSDINSSNNNSHSNSGDFVALGGLFDTAADISDLTWRPESLSAL